MTHAEFIAMARPQDRSIKKLSQTNKQRLISGWWILPALAMAIPIWIGIVSFIFSLF